MTKFSGTPISSKTARGVNAASGPIGSAISAVKNFMSLPSLISKTVQVIHKVITGKATDSMGTDGNPIMVNDQEGPVFRELVKYPGAAPFIPHGPLSSARNSLTRFNGTKVLGKTAVGHDSASRPMGSARNSVTKFSGTPISSKTARGVNAASGPIGSAISAVKNFMSLPSLISKTVQVIHKVITGKATGSMGTDGNPIMVNDQEGPVFRELVKYPGAAPFIPHGRNVILNAPKNTKVIPAGLTPH